jgi:hypothetical protein
MNKDQEVIKLKKKLKKYNDILKELAAEEETDTNKSVYKSIIIETGTQKKVLPSDLGESFLVVDDIKNLDELNKNEQVIIHAQDDLSKAEKTKKYFKRLNNSYGWVCTAFGVSRLVVALLL